MRKGILGSLAVLTAGASVAFGQMRAPTPPPPTAMMPSGVYGGSVQPAGMNGPVETIPPQMGMGGPGMGAPGMMADPSAGLMQGAPTYPPPGTYGGSPYPDPGVGSSGQVPHWWFNGEYLLLFAKSQPVHQPYVTTSAPGDFGVSGAGTTQLLYSTTSNQGYGLFSGFNLNGGWYKDADHRWGFEFGGMLSENKSQIYAAGSDANGVPTLARPFIGAGGAQNVFIVSNLGQASGALTVSTHSQFYGANGDMVCNLYRSSPDSACFVNSDFIFGFQFFQLQESLDFDSASTILGSGATFVGQPVSTGSAIQVHDGFNSENRFYGGQIGLRTSIDYGNWTFGFTGKVGFGLMHETMDIAGNSTITNNTNGLNASAVGGIYANSQNINHYTHDEFAYLPEGAFNFGYKWTSWFSTYVGYNVLYVSKVVRPGDAVPNAVNTSLIPTSNNYGTGSVTQLPNNSLTQTDFWVQGVTFGFTVKY